MWGRPLSLFPAASLASESVLHELQTNRKGMKAMGWGSVGGFFVVACGFQGSPRMLKLSLSDQMCLVAQQQFVLVCFGLIVEKGQNFA